MNWEQSSRLEWLEANGVGGYASGTASGANTRRYHGLLVAAMHPPVGRVVLLSKLEERIAIGEQWFDLGSNQYPGVVDPRGFELLERFERDLFPLFHYSAGGVTIRKTVAAIHGENTTVVVYEASEPVTLELRPFIAGRDYHSLTHANDAIRGEVHDGGNVLLMRPYEGVPALYLSIPGARFDARPDWYRNFEFPIEQERGLDAHEDLFTPGVIEVHVQSRIAVLVSTEDPSGRAGLALFDEERRRREKLLQGAAGPLERSLLLAADQFIVRRGSDRRTVIAGYHWFTDWGRDTMIALPGLCLTTGRYEDARLILLAFAESVSQGMIPNRFPDAGEQPEYNTVDATLWFFVAALKYLQHTRDEPFVQMVLLPVLRDIVAWHDRGTRHNIHVDHDGLLIAGSAGDQLTWMDVKIGDWVVTPRHGKPVEVNALWYNALSILSEFETRFGSAEAASILAQRAARVRESFEKSFWNREAGCLYDVVDGEQRDPSFRPNQIFAISLPHALLNGDRAERVVAAVEERLLTPRGLRSLASDDPRFIASYAGSPFDRDRAYHQGTVWSWLLGPYITALVRVRGAKGAAEARRILARFEPHLDEACAGTVSEIFDGNAPFAPRGCVAQAWSVAELLRVMKEELPRFEANGPTFRRNPSEDRVTR